MSSTATAFPALTLYRGEYELSTDPVRIDVDAVREFLATQSYWAVNISRAEVERSIAHSLSYGIRHVPTQTQVGFARVVTDFTSFAWIADVFIIEAHRGQGLSKWLMQAIIDHPELQTLRKMLLGTRDAHGLYEQFGFVTHPRPQRVMVRDMRR